MINIRKYVKSDSKALWDIYYNTIHSVNSNDYSQEQIEAWAPSNIPMDIWHQKMVAISPIIAEIDGVIVGYTDLQPDGLLDHFFCHHQYQGVGVGRALMNHIFDCAEDRGISRLYSEVSVTARPFYERQGFKVVKEQLIEVRGQELCNFVMEKHL